MLRNPCDIQQRMILVLHHSLLLVNVYFSSTRCTFPCAFTATDWYTCWHLHHYRHGKFTGTVWKYRNVGLQVSETDKESTQPQIWFGILQDTGHLDFLPDPEIPRLPIASDEGRLTASSRLTEGKIQVSLK